MPFTKLFQRAPAFRKSLPPGERIYAIGDVHGRLDLFDKLMGMIAADWEKRPVRRTRCVILGDVVDRGPQSRELLERLSTAKAPDLIVLKGNHEAALIDVRNGNHDAAEMWAAFGGMATLASFGIPAHSIDPTDTDAVIAAVRNVVSDELASWLADLPLSFSAGGYFFVHAGVRPGVAIARQTEQDLLWIRDEFLESKDDHGMVIVHGHSINRGGVEITPNRIGLDTGAYRTGCLSAVALERNEIRHFSTGIATG